MCKKDQQHISGGVSEVEVRHLHDEKNYRASLGILGETAQFVDLLSSAYKFLSSLGGTISTSQIIQHLALAGFLLSCHDRLIAGTLYAERGLITEAYEATRRAIEGCAFANRISLHPHLAMKWWNATDSDAAYQDYRNAFTHLFPEQDPFLSELGRRYDRCSKDVHCSLLSMLNYLDMIPTSSGFTIRLKSIGLSERTPTGPVLPLSFVWDTHFIILQVFARMCRADLKPVKRQWKSILASVKSELEALKRKWGPVLRQEIAEGLAALQARFASLSGKEPPSQPSS